MLYFISKPEFTFAICYRPFVRLLSSVCNVCAPYLGDWNFRQCFYAIWYLGHMWPFDKNFTEIVLGEPLRRGGGGKRRGYPDIAILDLSRAIYWKRCKIRGKSLLITNRKSHIGFRLVPKSVTLNDLGRRNSRNLCVISPNLVAFGTDYVKVVEDTPYFLRQKCRPKNLVCSDISLTGILTGDHP